MKSTIACFCIALSIGKVVHAEEIVLPPVPQMQLDEPSVGQAISPLKVGQRAPFTGILFSPEAVAKITVDLKSIDDKVKIEVDHSVKTCQVDSQYKLNDANIRNDALQHELQIKLDFASKENTILTNRTKQLEDQQDNKVWWIGGGLVAGTAISILTILGASLAH